MPVVSMKHALSFLKIWKLDLILLVLTALKSSAHISRKTKHIWDIEEYTLYSSIFFSKGGIHTVIYKSKTEALAAAMQYRCHPHLDVIYHYHDNPVVNKHLRICETCSKLYTKIMSRPFTTSKDTFTEQEWSSIPNVGDLRTISLKLMSFEDRDNGKGFIYNAPDVVVIETNKTITKVMQTYPVDFKPLADKGDVYDAANKVYLEIWNVYTIPTDALIYNPIENSLVSNISTIALKAITKKQMRCIEDMSTKSYPVKNPFVQKFRSNEQRIADSLSHFLMKGIADDGQSHTG